MTRNHIYYHKLLMIYLFIFLEKLHQNKFYCQRLPKMNLTPFKYSPVAANSKGVPEIIDLSDDEPIVDMNSRIDIITISDESEGEEPKIQLILLSDSDDSNEQEIVVVPPLVQNEIEENEAENNELNDIGPIKIEDMMELGIQHVEDRDEEENDNEYDDDDDDEIQEDEENNKVSDSESDHCNDELEPENDAIQAMEFDDVTESVVPDEEEEEELKIRTTSPSKKRKKRKNIVLGHGHKHRKKRNIIVPEVAGSSQQEMEPDISDSITQRFYLNNVLQPVDPNNTQESIEPDSELPSWIIEKHITV